MTVTNLTPPVISGVARQGQQLSVSTGTWSFDLDHLEYAYQWERCNASGASCVNIAGATTSVYTLTASDVGSTIRAKVTATEVAAPPPPGDAAYFVSDWADGLIGYKVGQFDNGYPWATIFQTGSPSTIDVGLFGGAPRSVSDDGRVAVIANPYGAGNVLKCEIRNTDPSTGSNNFQKAEVGSYKAVFPWAQGMEMWIVMEMYLPNEFGLASGGSNGFTNIADLHPNSGSGVPALGLGGYSTTNLQLYAGIPGSLQRKNFIALTSGNRNRKLDVVIGARIATTGGWVEAWLDGVNTIPRFNVPTAEPSETGPYWKQGVYKETASSFPGGKCICYFGATRIYDTRPF